MNHPIQPLEKDSHGVLRFKANAIVKYLLDNGGIDMNALRRLQVPDEDREQFAQLIGYSLSGFSDLSYARPETCAAAHRAHATGVTPEAALIAVLEDKLARIKNGLRDAACEAFDKHPSDLV